MKLWKRLLAIPIAASLVMGLLPAPALAEDTAHSHPICGEAHTDIGDHTGDNCKDATWTAWDGTSTITYDTNNTAYVYLEKDATRESRLEVKAGYTLYLCLNGQKLESSLTSSASQGMSQVINVSNGAKFILCDCKGGGTITHSSGAKGKGVRVGGSDPAAATFSMYGGTISGNHADDPRSGAGGAGVEIQNGTFKMYGGTISDNYEENAGSNYGGGGVCAHTSGTFTMYGGIISDNQSVTDAGGVTVVGGTMNIYGGTISNNIAKGDGGGIWTNINGFIISGNSVIENNTAVKGGGVYYGSSSNTMTISESARISGNTATGDGGGVYFGGDTFRISGNLDISGNKKAGADNNVYLPTNKYINIAGALTGSNPIGVTTEKTPDASNYVRIASGSKNDAAPEKFSYENDNTPVSATSQNNSTADLVVCKHNWNSTWSSDSFSHWHDCSICKGKGDIAAHTYDQQVKTKAYEKSSATCLSGTTYYMSCVCGAKGADTFEIGDKDPDNHSGILNNDWKSNDTNHWKEYSCCRAHAEEAAHSGGTATCQNKAVCSTCNKPYGDLGSHVPASTWSKDASGHWHACQTPNCNEQLAFAAHTPGPAATEDAPQLCTVCSYELAPALEHTHVWGAWISNGDGTHTRTCAKDGSHTETNACSGGIATCQNSAVCAVCNTAYGAKDMTNHTGGTEVRGSVEATTSTEGYTGDTYCKGCNTKLADGKTIPKKDSGSSGGSSSSGGTSGGTGSGSSGGNTTPSTSVTVPVSGEEKTIRVNSTVSSTTATIEDIDLSKLNTVIGNDVKTGVVTIDFSVLEKQIDTVKLPANVIKQIADAVKDPSNDAESLSIVLTDGTSIEFDEKALSKKTAQTNQTDITISIKRTTDSTLSALQQQAVGSQPAWDIKLTSGGKNISDMGGVITLHTPYELRSGEQSNGIVVYYVDENGNRESCETSYDPVKKLISWKTSHLSVYMIGYDENRVTPDTDTEDQSALNGSQVSKLKLPILLATGKGGNRKITISWRSYEDADGYDCYWSYCDGKRSYKKLATVKAAKDRVTSRRLANNRRYKYFVAAYKLIDGKKVYIAKSNSLHVALKDAKATNAKKVTVNQTNARLKAGDTFVIRSRTRLENTNKKELLHAAAYRYYTSDQSVASVSKTGKIKALKSGTCVIYVVANNGVYGTIKVTVN
ncbi:MAG: Ig-like domain-containing protein [Roseburia sp.]|nr:Ig-like domain-containing protein [Roseburia sp.]